MGKNSLWSKMFSGKTNQKKLIKKLKKLKKEYTVLDSKLMSGSISKKELDRYYELKEEINTMAKKFILKDGKLVLNTEEPKGGNEEVQPQAPVQPVQNTPTPPVSGTPVQVEQQMRAEEDAQMRAQQEAQMQAQIRAQQEAQFKQQQEAQFRAQQEAQMIAQQEAQVEAQIQAPPPQPKGRALVYVSMVDLPELNLGINEAAIPAFVEKIGVAMRDGAPFQFGPYTLNGSKILMYRFE